MFAHERIIRENYRFLLDNLEATNSGLHDKLYQDRVLSEEEKASISAENESFLQNEKLLSMLSRKTKDQFHVFLNALDTPGQRHIRDRLTNVEVSLP